MNTETVIDGSGNTDHLQAAASTQVAARRQPETISATQAWPARPDSPSVEPKDEISAAKENKGSDSAKVQAPGGAGHSRRVRKWLLLAAAVVGVAAGGHLLAPTLKTAMDTVSTDDAYVNGHVTLVAPRVSGQVMKVLVDDNYRVKKGDLLVQLDKEPYEVQVAIKAAAVASAEADLAAANAQVRGQIAQAGASRFMLQHAMEDVSTQTADLAAAVATLTRAKETLALAVSNLKRGEDLAPSGAMSQEDLDQRRQTVKVDQAAVDQALQQVYAIRVGLGLPAQPPSGKDLGYVPPDLDQNVSSVQQNLGTLLQSAAQFGYFPSKWGGTPQQTLEDFYKQDPQGNVNRILARLIPDAPLIKQAEAKLRQAREDLRQAELNLKYCDVVSEIDGVVTGRNVNPGSNVQAGQSLFAIRSIKEIWIDANFKETQLGDLRIGQPVKCDVDMYGGRHEYNGRISGFTMGTGQTLALLPAQNATGNFVKIVQRLPVRIELTDYDPDKAPLFIGLSVTPYVYYKEPPIGPHAGAVLQPPARLPSDSTDQSPLAADMGSDRE
jgi:membrane fusion protein (multidrug efflux system)